MTELKWNEELMENGQIKVWKIFNCKGCGKEFTLKGRAQYNLEHPEDLTYKLKEYCEFECVDIWTKE